MKDNMVIAQVDAPMAAWKIYRSSSKFASREHMLLSEALITYAESQTGISVEYIVHAFTNEIAQFLEFNDRDEIVALIEKMHLLLVTDQLHSFVRPFGGGRPRRLSTDEWEIDNPLSRFASSAMDPQNQFDGNAVPTHWILVQRRQMEEVVERANAARRDGRGRGANIPAALNAITSHSKSAARLAPAMNVNTTTSTDAGHSPSVVADRVDRLLSREEVLHLTGFRKSTLYAKIASRTFPTQVALSPRMSRWRESEVAAWLREPR